MGRGPYRVVLDTGSSITWISPEVANHLALPRGEERSCGWLTGSLAGYSTSATVKVGDVVQEDMPMAVFDCRLLRDHTGAPVDGSIGSDFLRRSVVVFRYCDNEMGFGPAANDGTQTVADHAAGT